MNKVPMPAALLSCLLQLGLLPAPWAQTVPASALKTPPRISLELRDTDIRDALRLVAKQGGINLVLSNDVTGAVTLDLEDVSLQETLDAILSVGGYEYTTSGSIITVLTLEELLEAGRKRDEYAASLLPSEPVSPEAMVVELRYVDAERMIPVVEKLLGPEGTVSLLKTPDHIARGSGNSAPNSGEKALQIGTQLSTSSQGQPAKSHTLVVVDQPARLEQISRVVRQIDVKPVQVVIEARFVEVALDETDKLGIDWNVLASATGGAAPHTFPLGNSSLGSFGPNVDGGGTGPLYPDAPDLVSTPGAPGLFTFGTLDFTAFSAILELIETDTRVQVVSNPRIVVGDRRTATILVGERFPILSANISEFGSVTEQLERYEPIGVQLEVTPSVLGDDEIELFVRPSSSSLGPLVTGSTGLSLARINSRQIDTSVTVKDRQTIVLGGLFTTRESDVERRVPILGSVPLLGRLFSHKTRSKERVDLVIFLTVAIVQEAGLTEEQREMFDSTSVGGDLATRVEFRQSPLELLSSAGEF